LYREAAHTAASVFLFVNLLYQKHTKNAMRQKHRAKIFVPHFLLWKVDKRSSCANLLKILAKLVPVFFAPVPYLALTLPHLGWYNAYRHYILCDFRRFAIRNVYGGRDCPAQPQGGATASIPGFPKPDGPPEKRMEEQHDP
jgi:hypothetical protein